MATALGLDIGGTGIKGSVVDLDTGRLVGDRVKLFTPDPPTPEAMVETAAKVVDQIGHPGPIGVGFPAVIEDGFVWTANNIDPSWIGRNAVQLLQEATGRQVRMVNDADAAALCEARFGAARGVPGVVLVVTLGTGIGSGLLVDGKLVPNVEIGMLELDGHTRCETHFAASAKTAEGLTWEQWLERVNRFLHHVKRIFWPRLLVIGGGVTKDWAEWGHLLDPELGAVRATKVNNAGIIGAATLVD